MKNDDEDISYQVSSANGWAWWGKIKEPPKERHAGRVVLLIIAIILVVIFGVIAYFLVKS